MKNLITITLLLIGVNFYGQQTGLMTYCVNPDPKVKIYNTADNKVLAHMIETGDNHLFYPTTEQFKESASVAWKKSKDSISAIMDRAILVNFDPTKDQVTNSAYDHKLKKIILCQKRIDEGSWIYIDPVDGVILWKKDCFNILTDLNLDKKRNKEIPIEPNVDLSINSVEPQRKEEEQKQQPAQIQPQQQIGLHLENAPTGKRLTLQDPYIKRTPVKELTKKEPCNNCPCHHCETITETTTTTYKK